MGEQKTLQTGSMGAAAELSVIKHSIFVRAFAGIFSTAACAGLPRKGARAGIALQQPHAKPRDSAFMNENTRFCPPGTGSPMSVRYRRSVRGERP